MSLTWIQSSAPTTNLWMCITSSSDGTKLAAASFNGGRIYTSSDSGNTWSNLNNSPRGNWVSIKSSSNGTKLAAVDTINIYTSTDSGSTWTVRTTGLPTSNVSWTSIASSLDGTKLAACNKTTAIYISSDSGITWTISNSSALSWSGITSSSDGTKLAACTFNDVIYTSTDSGITWSNSNNSPSNYWNSITSSSDGTKLAAVINFSKIYTSTDSGITWSNSNSSLSTVRWSFIASSSDGTKLAAVGGYQSGIYTSSDSGATWSLNNAPSSSDWRCICSSSDGTKLAAVINTGGNNDGIYTGSVYQYPCFKEGTLILTDKGYIPVQDLKKGDLVKTLLNGFLPIDMIGKRDIVHSASSLRIKHQLYKCSPGEYQYVFEPLVITGCHSILVDDFVNEEQREKTIEVNGNIYITDDMYRLPACADLRASVYETPGTYTIYHFALENADYYMNYGIYANGLLVETCSKRYLKECSNMEIIYTIDDLK